jgi:hypothetical protein
MTRRRPEELCRGTQKSEKTEIKPLNPEPLNPEPRTFEPITQTINFKKQRRKDHEIQTN